MLHREWDHHGDLPRDLPLQCRDVDQACKGLILDLKQRGHAGRHAGGVGRRVRPHGLLPGGVAPRPITGATIIRAASRCGWPAAASGAGSSMAKPTISATTSCATRCISAISTPPFCTVMGIDHQRLTYSFQGLDQRLTGTEESHAGERDSGVSGSRFRAVRWPVPPAAGASAHRVHRPVGGPGSAGPHAAIQERQRQCRPYPRPRDNRFSLQRHLLDCSSNKAAGMTPTCSAGINGPRLP